MIELTKAVFTTHIDSKGKLKDGKERFDCPKCNGEAYIKEQSVLPNGFQHFEFVCTDCTETWHESY